MCAEKRPKALLFLPGPSQCANGCCQRATLCSRILQLAILSIYIEIASALLITLNSPPFGSARMALYAAVCARSMLSSTSPVKDRGSTQHSTAQYDMLELCTYSASRHSGLQGLIYIACNTCRLVHNTLCRVQFTTN